MPLYSERKKVKGLVTSLYLWNAISDLSLLFFLAEGAWLTKSSIMWVGIGMMLSTSLEYSSSGQSSLFELSVIFPELHEKACDCLQKTAANDVLVPRPSSLCPQKKNKGEEGLVHVTDINFDLYPRILNMQTCLPAITTTLKLPASTAGKGCSEDTFAGAGLCQKLHHPASHPIFCMLLVLIVMYPLCCLYCKRSELSECM